MTWMEAGSRACTEEAFRSCSAQAFTEPLSFPSKTQVNRPQSQGGQVEVVQGWDPCRVCVEGVIGHQEVQAGLHTS